MKRFSIYKEYDHELGQDVYQADEFLGIDEFGREEWRYVFGTMTGSLEECKEQLRDMRDNVKDKDIEL
jgi:hypothetical protein